MIVRFSLEKIVSYNINIKQTTNGCSTKNSFIFTNMTEPYFAVIPKTMNIHEEEKSLQDVLRRDISLQTGSPYLSTAASWLSAERETICTRNNIDPGIPALNHQTTTLKIGVTYRRLCL